MIRVGIGYDVHRLKGGRALILGGVNIPHILGLDGHSDADVLVHAIMDSLLGAAALGDIGKLFPDTDDSFKDADSIELLKICISKLKEIGYTVGNIEPKLMPYILEMRENVASACQIDLNNVNIKATTEEKLGFTGNEEGISAQAVSLIFKA